VIIGDFDSIGQDGLPHDIPPDGAPVIIKDVTYVRYPTDKDYTDSELAIKYAAQAGCWEVILAGSLGTRLDHLLGNIYLLNKPAFAKLKIKIIEGEQEAYLVRDAARIHGKKGDTISFMPFSGKPVAQTDGGLKYDLSKYQLSMQGNMGISNVLLRPVVNIEVTGGTLLVIHQL
jgi:thiamine pyrophosphokinase